MSASQPAEVKPDNFYNGLWGHSKADEFPSQKTFTLSKKPNPKNSQKMATINKYFNFDTPWCFMSIIDLSFFNMSSDKDSENKNIDKFQIPDFWEIY